MGKVAIIGVPLDLGGNRRGVDMGPSALRLTHLATRIKQLGYDVVDTGDVDVPLPEEAHFGDPKKKYAKEIGEVCQVLRDLRRRRRIWKTYSSARHSGAISRRSKSLPRDFVACWRSCT